MTDQGGLIETTLADGVATITLNRPQRHNSLVPALLSDLLAAFEAAGADPEARSIVLAANGRSFSTGGDVGAFFDHQADAEAYAEETVGLLNRVMVTMMSVQKPIVAAVHGMVTGGSLGLVLASDVVLLAPEATFTPWYTVVGFSPDGGWTALLPQRIGVQRVASLLLENGTITAEQAVAWGLATRLAPVATIGVEARTVALDLADRKPGAVASAKRLLGGDLAAVAASLEAERAAFVRQIVTEEARAGMAAFLGR